MSSGGGNEQEIALYIAHLVNLAKEHKADTVVSTVRKLSPAERLLFFRSIEQEIADSPGLHVASTKQLVKLLTKLSAEQLYTPPGSEPAAAPAAASSAVGGGGDDEQAASSASDPGAADDAPAPPTPMSPAAASAAAAAVSSSQKKTKRKVPRVPQLATSATAASVESSSSAASTPSSSARSTARHHHHHHHSSSAAAAGASSSRSATTTAAPPVEPSEFVIGVWDYAPENTKGKLAFRKGDVIGIENKVAPEWWKGVRHGTFGLFPCSYVKAVPKDALVAEVLFDFVPGGSNAHVQLPLTKDTHVVVVSAAGEWTEGIAGDRAGKFPSSYVKVLETAEPAKRNALLLAAVGALPKAASLGGGTQSGASSKSSTPRVPATATTATAAATSIVPDIEKELSEASEASLAKASAKLDAAEATITERVAALRLRAAALRQREQALLDEEEALSSSLSADNNKSLRAHRAKPSKSRNGTQRPRRRRTARGNDEAPPVPPEEDDGDESSDDGVAPPGILPPPLDEDNIPPPPTTSDAQAASVHTVEKPSEPQDGDDADLWREAQTPDGRSFWFNRTTRAVRWTEPPRPGFRAADWREAKSAAGKTYFYNERTKETRWTKPAPNEKPLPDGWREAVSSSGKIYYYNRATNATTWERPLGDGDDSELNSSESSESDSRASRDSSSAAPTATSSVPTLALPTGAAAASLPALTPREERGPLKIQSDEEVALKKKRQDSFVIVLQHMAAAGMMPAPNVILQALAQNDDDVTKTIEFLKKK